MRIDQMIRELKMQKRDLERAIELLEVFERNSLEPHGYTASSNPGIRPPQPGRRGRKFLTLAERRAVSERMKLYWSARKDREDGTGPTQTGAATVSKQRESPTGTRR